MHKPEYKPKSDGGWLLSQLHNKPTTGIYYIGGHGNDNPGIEKKIPKGCKYCTFAECGIRTLATDPRVVNIEYEFIKGNRMFEKPTLVNKFLRKMYKEHSLKTSNRQHLRNTKSSISIKNYSKNFKRITNNYTAERARHTYTMSTYTLFSYYNTYNIDKFCNDLASYLKHAFLDEGTIKEFFNKLEYRIGYSGIIKLGEAESKTPSKKLRTYPLFNPEDFDFFYDLIETYGDEDFNSKSMQDIYDDIYKLIEKTINNSNIDLTEMIEDSFKYSLFPTVERVLYFYKNVAENVRTVLDFKYQFDGWVTITQQDLFHYLPGTYYNFICRSARDEEKAMKRRQLSPLNPIGALKTRKNRIRRRSLSQSPSKRTLKSLPRNRESFH